MFNSSSAPLLCIRLYYFIMHMVHHGCLKRKPNPPAHILGFSSTYTLTALPSCQGPTTLIPGPCNRWHLIQNLPAPSTSLLAALGLHKGNVFCRWKWWACLLLCPEAKFTSSTLDTGQDIRHWLDLESSGERNFPFHPTSGFHWLRTWVGVSTQVVAEFYSRPMGWSQLGGSRQHAQK